MPSRRAPLLPSVIDICPGLRTTARRAATDTRRLVDALVTAFSDADLLARDPTFAERADTTPHDHVAAHLIISARAFLSAIEALSDPP